MSDKKKTKVTYSKKRDFVLGAQGIGLIYPKDTLFLVQHIGEAGEPNKPEYTLYIGGMNAAPFIQSTKTGRIFTISWNDLVKIAKDAGVDENAPHE